jgi:NADPH:quinone reductase-like Zn-dependent oxidoreductase
MPEQTDYIAAAAVPLAGLTAWQGLFDQGRLKEGQHVLIHGGAGGLGHLAIQLAKAMGATVTATCAGEDTDFVRGLGADRVIDYKRERFEDAVRDIDLVLDLVAGETQDRSWSVLKAGGALISTVAPPSQEKAEECHVRAAIFRCQPDGHELAEIGRLIDNGKVKPVVDRVYPLDAIAEAERYLEEGHVRGKVVLRVS